MLGAAVTTARGGEHELQRTCIGRLTDLFPREEVLRGVDRQTREHVKG